MKILKKLRSLSIIQFSFILAFYFGVILNAPLALKMYEVSHYSVQFLFTVPLILTSLFFLIFYLLSIPYFRKPFFIFLTYTSAIACYAIYQYKILFNYDMMVNVSQTYVGESVAYLNTNSILITCLLGLIPSLFIFSVKFQPVKLKTHFITILTSLALVAVILGTSYRYFYKEYASVGRNNHYLSSMIVPAHFFNGVKYIYRHYFKEPLPYTQIGKDATSIKNQEDKPSLVILMVGETARAQNYAYNGYKRNTTPFTSSLDLIRIPHVESCGTATAVSVPCMFSQLTRQQFSEEKAERQDNALDILKRANVNVVWIDNNGGDKGVATRIQMRNVKHSAKYCDSYTCRDGVFLEEFDDEVKNLDKKSSQDTLLVMHIIGSHGPTYYQRYPKEMTYYTPVCDRSDIENCTDEEIQNVYDNSLRYTDWVMNQLIEKLKKVQDKYQVALLYLSDHGESLGEKGVYLHGAPYAIAPSEQTHVPWMIWLGNEFEKTHHIDEHAIKEKVTTRQYSQDDLFSSLLSLMQVKTSAFNPKQSLFK